MFYVYTLIDPRSNLPFYVGKGIGRRAESHLRLAKYHPDRVEGRKDQLILDIFNSGLEPMIEYVQEDMDEELAFELERELIALYGRRDLDTNGILTNISPGGNGSFARLPGTFQHTAETKQKLSKSTKQRYDLLSEDDKVALSQKISDGIKNSPKEAERRRKISEHLKGKPGRTTGKKFSDESRQKMRESAKKAWAARKAAKELAIEE